MNSYTKRQKTKQFANLMTYLTYRLEVVCIVYFFGHEIVHIC